MQALEESLQETMSLLDDERRDHDNDQRSWASSLAEREQQVATLQVELKRLKAAAATPSPQVCNATDKEKSPFRQWPFAVQTGSMQNHATAPNEPPNARD